MNEQVTDPAFAPVAEGAPSTGPQPDGTIRYKITEGDTYVDGVKVKPEVIGYVQLDEEAIRNH